MTLPTSAAYVELHCLSNFSFLQGASHPEDLAARAALLGHPALALTDRDGLHGIVRFDEAARSAGVQPIVGADVALDDGTRLVLLVRDQDGYRNLSRLITLSRRAAGSGEPCGKVDPVLPESTLFDHARGLTVLTGWTEGGVVRALQRGDEGAARARVGRLAEAFGREQVFLEAQRHLTEGEDGLLAALRVLSRQVALPLVATNGVRHATRDARRLHDVLTCIRQHLDLASAGVLLLPNAERHLRPAAEMSELFLELPEAVRATLAVAERCRFRLDEIAFRLPRFPVPEGETAFSYLHRLVHEGARRRYHPLTPLVSRQLAHELDVIERLDFAGYFLIVWEIVQACGERGILCQGRGSAANSAVCYCLGITAVDPIGLDLLFERFLSDSRREPPDIDLDIAHSRREEIIQHVHARYGREHAAMACEVISFRTRSAVRDVGKALGLSQAEVDGFSRALGGRGTVAEEVGLLGEAAGPEQARVPSRSSGPSGPQSNSPSGSQSSGPSSPRPGLRSRVLRDLVSLCEEIDDFPRHLGIHVGGMVISRDPLHEIVPIEPASMPGRTVIQWNKDDAARMGLVKIDLLGLGMLTLLQEAFALVLAHHGERILLERIPLDDPAVFEMLSAADTVGVFQVESRAQMNTLPRLRPRTFHDLVVEVALIRPGPIQGEMVHPYLRRRAGEEPVAYPHPSLEPILARTLGVPLFQEQGMKLAVVAGGFTPAEADDLRRAMSSSRSAQHMPPIVQRLRQGMTERGFSEEAQETVIRQVESFASFGFAESHAASFALLVNASAWMKLHYPVEFTAALLRAQPMGFYSVATIAADARRRGVEVLPVDVNRSAWEATVEVPTRQPRTGSGFVTRALALAAERGAGAGVTESPVHESANGPVNGVIRVGLRYVRGIGEGLRPRAEQVSAGAPYSSLAEFVRACGFPRTVLENLAAAGALDSFGLERRDALWEVGRLSTVAERGPLHAGLDLPDEDESPQLQPTSVRERVALDHHLVGLSAGPHPAEFARELLRARGGLSSRELQDAPTGRRVLTGGLVICRQRPPSAKGTTFLTLEDESGFINVVVQAPAYQRHRTLVRSAVLLAVTGRLERSGPVVNIVATDFEVLPLPAEGFAARSHQLQVRTDYR